MTVTIFLLVLLSAALHPMWNLMVKHDPQPARSYFVLAVGALLLSLVHGLLGQMDFRLPAAALPWLALSVAGQLIYGMALVATYKRGDMSIYYPIIRASPLFVVAVSFLVLGQQYDWYVIIGILLVLGGGALLVVPPGEISSFDGKTCLLAVLAMSGTGIYSIADGQAAQMLAAPVLYFYVQAVFVLLFGITLQVVGKLDLVALCRPAARPIVQKALIASGLLYASYVLILEAYAMGGDVALVTTVRQISIPLSVLLGGIWLREQGMAARFVAALILSSGIVITLVP